MEDKRVVEIQIEHVSANYSQEADSNSPVDGYQSLSIETSDAGGGKYYIISTKRWAFDSIEELTDLLKDFEKRTKDIV